ncbi:unnamed protein product, partial [Effrenium voratum]
MQLWSVSMPPMIWQTFGSDQEPAVGIRIPLPPLDKSIPILPATAKEVSSSEHLPEFSWLKTCNFHPRDAAVRFEEEGHKYYVHGQQMDCSEFDADGVISKMMRGANWPRAGYLKNLHDHALLESIAKKCPNLHYVVSQLRAPCSEQEAAEALRAELQCGNTETRGALNQFLMTPSDIKEMWRANGEAASAAGTWVHLLCECVLNGGSIEGTSLEMQAFQSFLGSTGRLMAYRTEWCVWGTQERMAGSIDFAAQDEKGHIVLFDWKRTKSLPTKFSNTFASMRPPLQHLPDAAGIKYRLQLNIYKWILEKYYGVVVVDMFVVCLHPEHAGHPWIDHVPHMTAEAEAIMAWQQSKVQAVQTDAIGGSQVPLQALLPTEIVRLISDMLTKERGCAVAVVVLRGPCRARILGFVGADEEGFWEVPGPERLMFLCSKRALQGHREVCHQASDLRRAMAESDVLGGASDAGAASGDDDNAFPQVGHAADDELCSQLPTSPSRASGRATAAKSQSRPSSQTAAPGGGVDLQPAAPPSDIAAADPDPEPVKDELDEEQALEESAYEVLRRRRLMPGASTSDTDFAALFGQLREANSGFQAFPEEMQDNSDTILEITRIWTEAVRARFANMSDYLIRVCVGALAFARTRQADIHIREHAMVYWIAEGHRTLRFHSGDCYMKTPSGAFQQHRGVPPDQGRVQNFLMHVEGEEEGADASQPWMLSTAKLIMIVKRQLTREITEDKLLHYMSEWCNTAKKQEASCCYEDCAIKYDDELTVPQHIVERLHKFYAQTFWCNVEVFKCCQAAQALAKRGLNVTRLFIGLSSGGVKQSLYSSHLQALYGHNFAYFDPNIWYHEEEMRKQVEQLNGCIILTGQETPATNRKLREDLFKKFASADGIAGRKPYGFCTKMIYTRGWKRLEANRMFRFSDVGKRDFNAILRRGFVWRFLARFEDPQVIESAYADIAKDGVFPKDPDLGDFLRSSAAVAAGLQLQHAFEAEHTKKECEEMIEQYAAMGGDGGLTEATMREACGLPPKDYRLAATRTAGVIILDAEQEDKSDDNWSAFRQGLLSFMLSRKMVTATPFALKPMKLQDGPNVTKDALLDGLTARKHCLKGPGKGKAEFAYIPLLTTGKSLGSIIDHTSRACELELPEAYAIEAFVEYVTACMHRREDAMILASVLKSAGSRRGRGRLAEQDKKLKETMLTKARKLEAAEEHAKQLLDRFPGQDRAAKRRRVVKSPDIKLEQGIEFVQKLQRASVYYKWIAVSTLTDEFLEFCDEASGKKNPESSILAHLYMACEDYVLTEWCKFLLTTYTPAHLSLHFDGVRISATAQASAAQICEQSEKHILETTGFSVKIREKKHLHVLEMLAAAAKTTSPPKFADDHKLRQAGNCIPHALACLGAASLEKVMAKLSQDSLPENVYMKETRGRTYKQSSVLCECELHPMLFLEKAPKGKWLLHLENGNSPHCVAVESLDASPAMVTVWDVNATFQMTDDAFLDALRCGADSSTVAFFLLSAPSESTVGSAAQLIDVEVGQMLDMAAGALGSVLGINVSSKEPVMVPDSDEEMQDVSLPAQHIACNPAADHGEFHWLDKDGMVTVDQILLNELAEEAARHLEPGRVRRCGNLYYTRAFGEKLLMLDSVNAGNMLTNLLPTHTSSWWPLVEDVFNSPACDQLLTSLLDEAAENQEFQCLSIDGTFRVCLSIMGQAKFNEPKSSRENAAFQDKESLRRVLTVRGRSGAVLAMSAVPGESSDDIEADVLQGLIFFAASWEHSKDLPRKLEGTKLTIGKLLFNLTAADRAEWLFNNLRFRHFLPRNVQMLMPSGTTSNEALHAELNSWFRQVQQLHRSTLQLKLRVLFLGKLLAHNMALYHPTARQMPSAHVLARRLGQSLWTKDEWSEWAAQTREAKLKAPIRVQVAHEQAAIAASGLKR